MLKRLKFVIVSASRRIQHEGRTEGGREERAGRIGQREHKTYCAKGGRENKELVAAVATTTKLGNQNAKGGGGRKDEGTGRISQREHIMYCGAQGGLRKAEGNVPWQRVRGPGGDKNKAEGEKEGEGGGGIEVGKDKGVTGDGEKRERGRETKRYKLEQREEKGMRER